jgi:hydroxymethylglutaryl-CoA lyase
MGIATGIDIEQLLALRAKVAGWLAGETLHGTLWRAGLPKTFLAARDRAAAEEAA